MTTYFSKVFYFIGDLIPFKYSFFYSLYRMFMLISINLDRKNVVWESNLNKQTKKNDFIVKLIK